MFTLSVNGENGEGKRESGQKIEKNGTHQRGEWDR